MIDGYHVVIASYCIALIGHVQDGEDIAQDVFVDVTKSLYRFKGHSTVRHWLFTIARNKCLKHLRKLRTRERLFHDKRHHIRDTMGRAPQATPEDEWDAQVHHVQMSHDIERVRQGLKRLDDWSRTLILMYYYEGLSLRAIARQQWKSESTIRRKINSARHELKHYLASAEEAHDT